MSDHPERARPAPRVSVIVPVYNAGPSLEHSVASILAQTLGPDAVEGILVDDGSTDDSAARLDALAAAHPNLTVIHQENSGWPGKPRNVGMDVARGTWVQFLDQDDRLAPDALERCLAMADEHGTDLVIGKVVSDFRGVPHGLFRQDRPTCTVFDAPLIDSLTPHKLFRLDFLRDHGIRYAEGRRRLEDQLFMVQTYFAGARASVLGSHPCYFYLRRPDQANAGSARIDPTGYYGNLREVLDVVLAATEPGPVQDGFLRRFYRVEMLSRLDGPAFAGADPAYRQDLVDAVGSLAESVMTPGVAAGLAPLTGVRARLAAERDAARLAALADRLDRVRVEIDCVDAIWRRSALQVRLGARLVDDDGPLEIVANGDTLVLAPRLTATILEDPVDVAGRLADVRLQAMLIDPETAIEWRPSTTTVDPAAGAARSGGTSALAVGASAVVDPARVAAGGRLGSTTWRIAGRLNGLGVDRTASVGAPARLPDPALLDDGRILRVDADSRDLILRLGASALSEVVRVEDIARQRGGGRTLTVRLPLAGDPRSAIRPVLVALERQGRRITRQGRLEAVSERWHVLVTCGPVRGRVRRGRWAASVALDGPDGPWTPLGEVRIDVLGRLHFADQRPVGLRATVRHAVLQAGRRLKRYVPAPVRARLRRFRPAPRPVAGS